MPEKAIGDGPERQQHTCYKVVRICPTQRRRRQFERLFSRAHRPVNRENPNNGRCTGNHSFLRRLRSRRLRSDNLRKTPVYVRRRRFIWLSALVCLDSVWRCIMFCGRKIRLWIQRWFPRDSARRPERETSTAEERLTIGAYPHRAL